MTDSKNNTTDKTVSVPVTGIVLVPTENLISIKEGTLLEVLKTKDRVHIIGLKNG